MSNEIENKYEKISGALKCAYSQEIERKNMLQLLKNSYLKATFEKNRTMEFLIKYLYLRTLEEYINGKDFTIYNEFSNNYDLKKYVYDSINFDEFIEEQYVKRINDKW